MNDELNIDGLKKRIQDEREKYGQVLQDIPRSADHPDYKWHINRSNAQQYKLEGLEMALMILIGQRVA